MTWRGGWHCWTSQQWRPRELLFIGRKLVRRLELTAAQAVAALPQALLAEA